MHILVLGGRSSTYTLHNNSFNLTHILFTGQGSHVLFIHHTWLQSLVGETPEFPQCGHMGCDTWTLQAHYPNTAQCQEPCYENSLLPNPHRRYTTATIEVIYIRRFKGCGWVERVMAVFPGVYNAILPVNFMKWHHPILAAYSVRIWLPVVIVSHWVYHPMILFTNQYW